MAGYGPPPPDSMIFHLAVGKLREVKGLLRGIFGGDSQKKSSEPVDEVMLLKLKSPTKPVPHWIHRHHRLITMVFLVVG